MEKPVFGTEGFKLQRPHAGLLDYPFSCSLVGAWVKACLHHSTGSFLHLFSPSLYDTRHGLGRNKYHWLNCTLGQGHRDSDLHTFLYQYQPKDSVFHCIKWSEVKWNSLSHVQLFATPWTIQSLEFSRQEYWSG